ncbi:MAG: hypothetical protein PVG86_06200 [Desulfobacterales bacterium]|jgi:hypothetical protein
MFNLPCPVISVFKIEPEFNNKEGENFNHPREIGYAFHGAGTNTLTILRINPPRFGGGLKFEPVEANRRSRPSGTLELNKGLRLL